MNIYVHCSHLISFQGFSSLKLQTHFATNLIFQHNDWDAVHRYYYLHMICNVKTSNIHSGLPYEITKNQIILHQAMNNYIEAEKLTKKPLPDWQIGSKI